MSSGFTPKCALQCEHTHQLVTGMRKHWAGLHGTAARVLPLPACLPACLTACLPSCRPACQLQWQRRLQLQQQQQQARQSDGSSICGSYISGGSGSGSSNWWQLVTWIMESA